MDQPLADDLRDFEEEREEEEEERRGGHRPQDSDEARSHRDRERREREKRERFGKFHHIDSIVFAIYSSHLKLDEDGILRISEEHSSDWKNFEQIGDDVHDRFNPAAFFSIMYRRSSEAFLISQCEDLCRGTSQTFLEGVREYYRDMGQAEEPLEKNELFWLVQNFSSLKSDLWRYRVVTKNVMEESPKWYKKTTHLRLKYEYHPSQLDITGSSEVAIGRFMAWFRMMTRKKVKDPIMRNRLIREAIIEVYPDNNNPGWDARIARVRAYCALSDTASNEIFERIQHLPELTKVKAHECLCLDTPTPETPEFQELWEVLEKHGISKPEVKVPDATSDSLKELETFCRDLLKLEGKELSDFISSERTKKLFEDDEQLSRAVSKTGSVLGRRHKAWMFVTLRRIDKYIFPDNRLIRAAIETVRPLVGQTFLDESQISAFCADLSDSVLRECEDFQCLALPILHKMEATSASSEAIWSHCLFLKGLINELLMCEKKGLEWLPEDQKPDLRGILIAGGVNNPGMDDFVCFNVPDAYCWTDQGLEIYEFSWCFDTEWKREVEESKWLGLMQLSEKIGVPIRLIVEINNTKDILTGSVFGEERSEMPKKFLNIKDLLLKKYPEVEKDLSVREASMQGYRHLFYSGKAKLYLSAQMLTESENKFKDKLGLRGEKFLEIDLHKHADFEKDVSELKEESSLQFRRLTLEDLDQGMTGLLDDQGSPHQPKYDPLLRVPPVEQMRQDPDPGSLDEKLWLLCKQNPLSRLQGRLSQIVSCGKGIELLGLIKRFEYDLHRKHKIEMYIDRWGCMVLVDFEDPEMCDQNQLITCCEKILSSEEDNNKVNHRTAQEILEFLPNLGSRTDWVAYKKLSESLENHLTNAREVLEEPSNFGDTPNPQARKGLIYKPSREAQAKYNKMVDYLSSLQNPVLDCKIERSILDSWENQAEGESLTLESIKELRQIIQMLSRRKITTYCRFLCSLSQAIQSSISEPIMRSISKYGLAKVKGFSCWVMVRKHPNIKTNFRCILISECPDGPESTVFGSDWISELSHPFMVDSRSLDSMSSAPGKLIVFAEALKRWLPGIDDKDLIESLVPWMMRSFQDSRSIDTFDGAVRYLFHAVIQDFADPKVFAKASVKLRSTVEYLHVQEIHRILRLNMQMAQKYQQRSKLSEVPSEHLKFYCFLSGQITSLHAVFEQVYQHYIINKSHGSEKVRRLIFAMNKACEHNVVLLKEREKEGPEDLWLGFSEEHPKKGSPGKYRLPYDYQRILGILKEGAKANKESIKTSVGQRINALKDTLAEIKNSALTLHSYSKTVEPERVRKEEMCMDLLKRKVHLADTERSMLMDSKGNKVTFKTEEEEEEVLKLMEAINPQTAASNKAIEVMQYKEVSPVDCMEVMCEITMKGLWKGKYDQNSVDSVLRKILGIWSRVNQNTDPEVLEEGFESLQDIRLTDPALWWSAICHSENPKVMSIWYFCAIHSVDFLSPKVTGMVNTAREHHGTVWDKALSAYTLWSDDVRALTDLKRGVIDSYRGAKASKRRLFKPESLVKMEPFHEELERLEAGMPKETPRSICAVASYILKKKIRTSDTTFPFTVMAKTQHGGDRDIYTTTAEGKVMVRCVEILAEGISSGLCSEGVFDVLMQHDAEKNLDRLINDKILELETEVGLGNISAFDRILLTEDKSSWGPNHDPLTFLLAFEAVQEETGVFDLETMRFIRAFFQQYMCSREIVIPNCIIRLLAKRSGEILPEEALFLKKIVESGFTSYAESKKNMLQGILHACSSVYGSLTKLYCNRLLTKRVDELSKGLVKYCAIEAQSSDDSGGAIFFTSETMTKKELTDWVDVHYPLINQWRVQFLESCNMTTSPKSSYGRIFSEFKSVWKVGVGSKSSYVPPIIKFTVVSAFKNLLISPLEFYNTGFSEGQEAMSKGACLTEALTCILLRWIQCLEVYGRTFARLPQREGQLDVVEGGCPVPGYFMLQLGSAEYTRTQRVQGLNPLMLSDPDNPGPNFGSYNFPMTLREKAKVRRAMKKSGVTITQTQEETNKQLTDDFRVRYFAVRTEEEVKSRFKQLKGVSRAVNSVRTKETLDFAIKSRIVARGKVWRTPKRESGTSYENMIQELREDHSGEKELSTLNPEIEQITRLDRVGVLGSEPGVCHEFNMVIQRLSRQRALTDTPTTFVAVQYLSVWEETFSEQKVENPSFKICLTKEILESVMRKIAFRTISDDPSWESFEPGKLNSSSLVEDLHKFHHEMRLPESASFSDIYRRVNHETRSRLSVKRRDVNYMPRLTGSERIHSITQLILTAGCRIVTGLRYRLKYSDLGFLDEEEAIGPIDTATSILSAINLFLWSSMNPNSSGIRNTIIKYLNGSTRQGMTRKQVLTEYDNRWSMSNTAEQIRILFDFLGLNKRSHSILRGKGAAGWLSHRLVGKKIFYEFSSPLGNTSLIINRADWTSVIRTSCEDVEIVASHLNKLLVLLEPEDKAVGPDNFLRNSTKGEPLLGLVHGKVVTETRDILLDFNAKHAVSFGEEMLMVGQSIIYSSGAFRITHSGQYRSHNRGVSESLCEALTEAGLNDDRDLLEKLSEQYFRNIAVPVSIRTVSLTRRFNLNTSFNFRILMDLHGGEWPDWDYLHEVAEPISRESLKIFHSFRMIGQKEELYLNLLSANILPPEIQRDILKLCLESTEVEQMRVSRHWLGPEIPVRLESVIRELISFKMGSVTESLKKACFLSKLQEVDLSILVDQRYKSPCELPLILQGFYEEFDSEPMEFPLSLGGLISLQRRFDGLVPSRFRTRGEKVDSWLSVGKLIGEEFHLISDEMGILTYSTIQPSLIQKLVDHKMISIPTQNMLDQVSSLEEEKKGASESQQ